MGSIFKKIICIGFYLALAFDVDAQIININPGFEDGTWENNWIASSNNDNEIIEIATNPTRHGNYSLHFQHEGTRAEVITNPNSNGHFSWREEYWIGYSIYLEDWNTNPANWNTLLQTHTVPQNSDWTSGSGDNGWTLFTDYNASSGNRLNFHAQILSDPMNTIPTSGAIGPKAWSIPVPENEWLDFVIHFIHSTSNDGIIQVWYNGELVVDLAGPNIHYLDRDGDPREQFTGLQMGSYKGEGVLRSMYVDEVRIAGANSAYEDVAPRGNPPANSPPVLSNIDDYSVTEGNSLNITLSASDPDGDPLIFSSSPNLNFINLTDNNNGTASLSISPEEGDVGSYNVTFTVTDSEGLSDFETVTITIVDAGQGNSAPVISPLEDVFVYEGNSLDIQLSSSDPDGDILQYSISPQSEFITLTDNQDGTGIINIAPQSIDIGVHNFTISVTDEHNATDAEVFAVTVENEPGNSSPILNQVGDIGVSEGNTLNVQISASDVDGDDLFFFISPDDLPFVSLVDNLNGTASLNLSPLQGDFGIYNINVTVKDPKQRSDSEVFTVYVDKTENGNTVPMLFTLEDQVINSGEAIMVELFARDADGDDIFFSISPELEFLTLEDSLNGKGFLFIAPREENIGKHEITVSVTDINGSTDRKVFDVLVNDNNLSGNSNIINSGATFPIYGSILMLEDKYFSGGSAYSYKNIPVSGTDNDDLYLNLRYGDSNYEIPVPDDGLYTIRLHFAEMTFRDGSIGSRVFNVDIEEGQDKMENYDINADVGPKTAAIKTFSDIEVLDGYISINLETVVQNALISGIEIIEEVQITTGIDDNELNNQFKIFPNPTNGVFSIERTSGNLNNFSTPFVIHDLAGKIVHKSSIIGSREVIDLTGKKGLYIIKLGNQQVEKILIH